MQLAIVMHEDFHFKFQLLSTDTKVMRQYRILGFTLVLFHQDDYEYVEFKMEIYYCSRP